MSAPMKPWEQARNLQSSAPMLHNLPGSSSSRSRTGPPSVPPRPAIMGPSTFMSSSYNRSMGVGYSPYDTYGSYGGGYGTGYGSYGSYPGYRGGMGGMYGGYGGGMYGNNMYGLGPESRFIQLAEESTRPAFQGIESLVRAFGSIAMMFDSTFFAVQSSFRAVLGVAENFGRIRTMFGQLWQSFALLRFLNWCYRKLMTMFGFKVAEDLGKAAWNDALKEANRDGIPMENTSSWPIFMFLGMIVSAPYLISKLLPPVIDKRDPKNWTSPGRAVRAIHSFQATGPQELSLNPGDKVVLAPMSIQQEMNLGNTGWVYATSKHGAGIIPLNYVQPVGSSLKEREPVVPAPAVEQAEDIRKLGEEFDKVGASSQEN